MAYKPEEFMPQGCGVGGLSQGARTGWFCAVGDHPLLVSWEDGEQGQEASFLVTLLTARIPS